MKTLACLFFLGICSASSAACGGATTGGGSASTVNGQAAGEPVASTDTVGIVETQTLPSPNGAPTTLTTAGVAILNIPNTCAILQRHGEPANVRVLSFSVSAPGASVPVGTYPIGPNNGTTLLASAEFATTDAKCNNVATETAKSGTVTMTTISNTVIQGSFDFTMSNGDHLSGTFDAPVCTYSSTTTSAPPACGS
jgi:hypothetical protein